MPASEIMDVSRHALIVLLQVGAPLMVIALLVGLIIALFQALTQVQEITLTFVPKILVMFIALIFLLPFMFRPLGALTERLTDHIVSG